MIVLSFDIGIRNLAFCMLDVSGEIFNVLEWDNYDLISGTDTQSATRCVCGGPASWVDNANNLKCKKCVKKEQLVCLPKDFTINMDSLRKLSKQENWTVKAKPKKTDFLFELKKRYLLPFKPEKTVAKTSLVSILDALNRFLDIYINSFAKADLIRIENQPVFNNPTMKSVQIILFTLITHRLQKEKLWSGEVCFVHASKKTEEDKEAINSYKGRKDAAEKLVLQKIQDDVWRNFFLSKQKRSDLADAFLMSVRLDK